MEVEDPHAFAFGFPQGRPGQDRDPNNVLSRSLHYLLEKGHPQEAVTLCMLGDLDVAPEEPMRWFGAFILTQAERVLYFPGFFRPKGRIVAIADGAEMSSRRFRVDHLTLESDLQSWHLTEEPSRRGHQGGPSTNPVGDGRVVWCGMSVARNEVFRELHRETVATESMPGADAQRRIEEFKKAAFAEKDHIFPLPPSNTFSAQPEFLHFALIVGPEGFPVYQSQHLMTPHDSPWVDLELPDPLTDVSLRSHRLPLGGGLEVEVAATRLPGRLTVPIAFTSA